MMEIKPLTTVPAEFDHEFVGYIRGDWEILENLEDHRMYAPKDWSSDFVIKNRSDGRVYRVYIYDEWYDVNDIFDQVFDALG